ncbi:BTB/POZ protein [Leptodontidium sp. MPI-SDFR-AT-0119]|nr:BTB/POZ protein [Leptodontidium sp. MPI-SDFR-AT-0119]
MDDPETSGQSTSAPPPPSNSRQITLQVGERRFVTVAETLTHESGFFAALLSGRRDNEQADGSLFIDADPELFEHVLRYLRRGVLPIFYDSAKGHDYSLYLALLEEAKYFQIPRLENWLKRRGYLEAIKIRYSGDVREGIHLDTETLATDEQVEYHPTWQTIRVYICPRGISAHRGNQTACGRQCRNAQGDDERMYEDEQILTTLVIRKRLVFDPAALTGELDHDSK